MKKISFVILWYRKVCSCGAQVKHFPIPLRKSQEVIAACLPAGRKAIFLIFFCICICGCSIPSVARQNQLSAYYKEETKKKSSFFGGQKPEFFKDFRQDEAYEEDMTALKEEAEKYISSHPDLSDTEKANLRELKVTEGASRKEVELLLGAPDKVSRLGAGANYNATELWIYKISRIRAFTVFIVPICFVHEGYYLYFKDDVLAGIERHYLRQIIEQGAGPGIVQKDSS